jgi:hypothetical protein
VAIRYYRERAKVDLHRLTLIEVVSAAPRDDVFSPISWSFRTGLENDLVEDRDRDDLRDAYVYRTRGGPGLSRRLGGFGTAYAFLEASADVSTALVLAYALAAGPRRRQSGQSRPLARHLHAVTRRPETLAPPSPRLHRGPAQKRVGARDHGKRFRRDC